MPAATNAATQPGPPAPCPWPAALAAAGRLEGVARLADKLDTPRLLRSLERHLTGQPHSRLLLLHPFLILGCSASQVCMP